MASPSISPLDSSSAPASSVTTNAATSGNVAVCVFAIWGRFDIANPHRRLTVPPRDQSIRAQLRINQIYNLNQEFRPSKMRRSVGTPTKSCSSPTSRGGVRHSIVPTRLAMQVHVYERTRGLGRCLAIADRLGERCRELQHRE